MTVPEAATGPESLEQLPPPDSQIPQSSTDSQVPPSAPEPQDSRSAAGRLLGSASLVAGGNIASRLLGLVREQVIAGYFAVGLEASAFSAAARVPTMIYDLLIGGMLSAALVPVLSSYAANRRDEFWRVVSVLLTVVALGMGLMTLAVYALAGPLARFLAPNFEPEGIALVADYLRVISPAVLVFGLAGTLTGVLYARERFGPPALAMTVYNLGMIVSVVLWHDSLGGYALPLGVTLGSLFQLGALVPGLRGGRIRPRVDLRHPALHRILVLYAPIGAGLVISQLQVVADTRFASAAGDDALAVMRYATTLVQFPHGLVSVAISLAILPALAAAHARRETQTFERTLARGVRTVLALTLPAAVGLAVLAEPVVGLVFQHGAFGGAARMLVSGALLLYLVGLPFVAVDWPLNYAFYARQNTLIPALVGVFSVGVYLVVAYCLGPSLNLAGLPPDRVYLGLVLADSCKHMSHALVMLVLVHRLIGPANLSGAGRTTLAAGAAALVMGAVVWGVDQALGARLGGGTLPWAIRVAAGCAIGAAVYLPLAAWLKVDEIAWVLGVVRERVG